MNAHMCEERGSQEEGSVVLRLNTSRKVVASTLRRAANPPGLSEVLLLQDSAGGGGRGRTPRDGLGTFYGVFVPCTCTIFGVVVFLRLGFVVGQAGIWCTLLIVALSFVITTITTLSLCMLMVESGDSDESSGHHHSSSSSSSSPMLDPGIYLAVRRSVGPELGAALGLAFYFAFTVNTAFYTTSFAVMVSDALPELASNIEVFPWNPKGTWVNVIFASAALLPVTLASSKGVVFSARASFATLSGIVLCIIGALAYAQHPLMHACTSARRQQ